MFERSTASATKAADGHQPARPTPRSLGQNVASVRAAQSAKKRCASPRLLSGDENLPRNWFHASAQGANNGDVDSILSHWSRKSPTGPSIASRLSAAICQNLVYACASVPGL